MIRVPGWDLHPFTRECGLVENDNKMLVNVDENACKYKLKLNSQDLNGL